MLTPAQRDILIRTVWGEAANQGPEGWQAVASVVRNRAADPGYPSDPAAVALQPKQFSAWNQGSGGNALPYSIAANSPDYNRVGQIVDQVFSGQAPDPTGGAVNYYAPTGMAKGQAPDWWKTIDPASVRVIGGHVFGAPVSSANQNVQRPVLPTEAPQTASRPSVFGGLASAMPAFASGPLTKLGQAFTDGNAVVSSYQPVNQPAGVTGAEVQNLANGDRLSQYDMNGKTIKTLLRGNTNYAVLG